MIRSSFIIGLQKSFQEYSTSAQRRQGIRPMKFSLIGVRNHHQPLIMNPEVSLHIIHLYRLRQNEKESYAELSDQCKLKKLTGWQLLGFLGQMSSKTRVILCGFCRAEWVYLLLWNSLSWYEWVTLSVGFAKISSHCPPPKEEKSRKENMCLEVC